MKLLNKSTRPYHVAGVLIPPGIEVEVPDSAAADIKGIPDLHVVTATDVEFTETEKGMTKAELQDALTALNVEFPSNANKAELQALLEESTK